jgi:hypothetical protein
MREGEVLSHELLHAAYPELIEFARRARHADALGDYVSLQKDLAKRGWAIRDFHQQLKHSKSELRASAKTAKAAGDRQALASIDGNIKGIDLTLEANRRHWYALRVVQDGVVWRVLSHQRHRIAVLGEGTPINDLSASFPNEVAGAQQRWDEGKVALLCDLSNCIRTGDFLLLHPEENRVDIVEVKESERGGTGSKQMRTAALKAQYLNVGRMKGDPSSVILTPDSPPRLRTHLADLEGLFRTAARSGWAFGKVGHAAIVHVLDARRAQSDDPEETVRRIRSREAAFRRRLGLAWRDVPTYEWNSLSRVQRDQRHASPAIAPFSIFPFGEETCAALAIGWLSYKTIINLALVEAALRGRGLSVERREQPPGSDGIFLRVRRGNVGMDVPQMLAEQLLVELLSLSAFVRGLERAISRAESESDTGRVHVGIGWSNEEAVWR